MRVRQQRFESKGPVTLGIVALVLVALFLNGFLLDPFPLSHWSTVMVLKYLGLGILMTLLEVTSDCIIGTLRGSRASSPGRGLLR
jgi:hypothetical protein